MWLSQNILASTPSILFLSNNFIKQTVYVVCALISLLGQPQAELYSVSFELFRRERGYNSGRVYIQRPSNQQLNVLVSNEAKKKLKKAEKKLTLLMWAVSTSLCEVRIIPWIPHVILCNLVHACLLASGSCLLGCGSHMLRKPFWKREGCYPLPSLCNHQFAKPNPVLPCQILSDPKQLRDPHWSCAWHFGSPKRNTKIKINPSSLKD